MNKVKLYDALKASYGSRDQQKNAFKNQGYVFDSDLSKINEQVYYNPKEKKLLYTVKGTNPFSLQDLGTDLYLATGNLKSTNRYKEAKDVFEKAKKRYNPQQTTLAGHSLGGLVQYIGGKNDKIYTLDKGAIFGQRTRSNETAYRTSGDLVSLLSANNKRMNTLNNPNLITGNVFIDGLNAHNVDNIKNKNIYI